MFGGAPSRTARNLPRVRLFVDDLHDPPDDGWTVARTSGEALAILRTSVVIEELSLGVSR